MEQVTIYVPRGKDYKGLSATEIIISSEVKGHFVQPFIKAGKVEYRSNNGIEEDIFEKDRRVSISLLEGVSKYKDFTLRCAHVEVASGPQMGKKGILIWHNEGPIRISGTHGYTVPAIFLSSRGQVDNPYRKWNKS